MTCSALWDRIVVECMSVPGGFSAMFAWDTRSGIRNRIGTIQECIGARLVPGLRLTADARKRLIVVRDGGP